MRLPLILLAGLAFVIFLVSLTLMLIPPQLTEQKIQAALDAKLPFTSKPDKPVIFTIPKGTRVTFGPHGQVFVESGYSARSRFSHSVRVEGHIKVQGSLVYETDAIYIRDLDIHTLTGEVATSQRTRVLGSVLNKLLATHDGDLLEKLDIRNKLPPFLKVQFADIRVLNIDGSKWWHPFAPLIIWLELPLPGLLLYLVMVSSALLCLFTFLFLTLRSRR